MLELELHGFTRVVRLYSSAAVRTGKPQRAIVDVAPDNAGARPAQLVVPIAPELPQVVVARRAPRSAWPQPCRCAFAVRRQRQFYLHVCPIFKTARASGSASPSARSGARAPTQIRPGRIHAAEVTVLATRPAASASASRTDWDRHENDRSLGGTIVSKLNLISR